MAAVRFDIANQELSKDYIVSYNNLDRLYTL